MKRKKVRYLSYFAMAALLSVAACSPQVDGSDSYEDELPRSGGPVLTRAEIMPIAGDPNRSDFILSDELKLHKDGRFSKGEELGLFACKGEITYSNLHGVYVDYMDDDVKVHGFKFDDEPDPNRISEYFTYSPYRAGIENENEVSVYDEDDRAIDFVAQVAGSSGLTLYQGGASGFYHIFAVVSISMGEGFEDFDGEVLLQLQRKPTHIWMDAAEGFNNYNHGAMGAVQLKYGEMSDPPKERRLATVKNEAGRKLSDGSMKATWEVLVPCLPLFWQSIESETTGGVTVEAIVLQPKPGNEIFVPVDNYSTFVFTTRDGLVVHGLRGTTIYNVEVKKQGVEASVFPYSVEKWEEKKIEETLKAGINNGDDLRNFIMLCNNLFDKDSYTEEEIASKISEGGEWGKLLQYGTADEEGHNFTIYLLADIDAGSVASSEDLRLDRLPIPFDGRGHAISNLSLKGSFCGTLGSTLKNLTLRDIRIVPDGGQSEPIGFLAGTMVQGGSIDGCRIENGWLQCQTGQAVGAAVGKASGGSIRNCSFSGIITGGTPGPAVYDGLVGNADGGTPKVESNRNDIIIY